MNIPHSVIAIMCLGLSSAVGADSRGLVIVPGVGVRGVMELGMSVSNLLTNARRYYICDEAHYYPNEDTNSWEMIRHVRMPDLGLETEVWEGYEGSLKNVSVCVDPAEPKRFHGALAGGISFSSTNGVARQQVIDVFGDVESISDNAKFLRALSLGKNISTRHEHLRLETLNYCAKGIQFNLKNDIVTDVHIRWLSSADTTTPTDGEGAKGSAEVAPLKGSVSPRDNAQVGKKRQETRPRWLPEGEHGTQK